MTAERQKAQDSGRDGAVTKPHAAHPVYRSNLIEFTDKIAYAAP